MEIIKVSSNSEPASIAGAVAGIIKEKGSVEIQTIGAGALNQAIKGVVIARGFIAPSGIDLISIPSFTNLIIDDEKLTGIKLLIETR